MAKKVDNGKAIAIVSYITIIGWIVALIMNNQQKTKIGSFHIRQSLLVFIAGFVFGFVPFLNVILYLALLVLWIYGLVSAIQGEMKPIPILGKLAQDWFKGL